MEKSKTIEELIKVLFGDINFDDKGGRVDVEMCGVPCIMQYKDGFKNVDALKVL